MERSHHPEMERSGRLCRAGRVRHQRHHPGARGRRKPHRRRHHSFSFWNHYRINADANKQQFTGLSARGDMLPGALNLHQTKFLELARALAAKPRLLMLDEVLSGLTPAEIDDAVALIARIREGGTAIVLVEHVMRVVTALSDRIVVLDQGRVLAEGAVSEVMRRDDVAEAYLGVAHA